MDSDQEIEFIQEEEVKQKDSGMSSLTPSPPERKSVISYKKKLI